MELEISRRVIRIDFRTGKSYVSRNYGLSYYEQDDDFSASHEELVDSVSFHLGDGSIDVAAHGRNVDLESYRPEFSGKSVGKPIVYLDQNKWIELARVIHGNSRLDPTELRAAKRFIEACDSRSIITPLSHGHLIETSKKMGEQRINLSMIMLRLSRGWQLEHPLEIRRHEALEMVARRRGIPLLGERNVVSLKPYHLIDSSMALPPSSEGANRKAHEYSESIIWAATLFDLFADASTSKQNPVRHLINIWCNEHAVIARIFAEDPKARSMSQKLAFVKFLDHEMKESLATYSALVGMPLSDFSALLWELAEKGITDSPALGLYTFVMHSRMRNSGLKWNENHYIDIQYLTAASAYCDFVLGEGDTLDHINRARKSLPVKAKTGKRFTDLMRLVDAMVQK